MEGTSNQPLEFVIDRLNVTKLVGARSPSSTSVSPRLTQSSDFDRLPERICLRLFDNTVRLPLARSGVRTLTFLDIFEFPRGRVLLEQKAVVINHLCVVLPGAHLRTATFYLPVLTQTMQRPEPLPAPSRIPLSVHRSSSTRNKLTIVVPASL